MSPYLSIIVAAIIFGSSGFFIKTVDLPVSTITFVRMAVPFSFISLVFVFRRKPFPGLNDPLMVIASMLNGLRLFFYFAGYTFGTISTTVILLYTWPVFATCWSVLFMGERLTRVRLILFVVAAVGVALVNLDKALTLSDQQLIGVLCILLSALIYSMTIVMFKKRSQDYDPFEIVWFQNCVGTLIFLPCLLLTRPWPLMWQSGLAGVYAVLIGVVGFGLFFKGLKAVDASRASFLTYIEVVSGIVIGVVFFDEHLSWHIILGGVLIVLSAIAFTFEKGRDKPG